MNFGFAGHLGRRRATLVAVIAAGALAVPAAAGAAPNDLFAVNLGAGTISQFTIGSGGLLSANGSVSDYGDSPWQPAITPDGKYLYVANIGNGTISEYSIGGGGTLSPLSPATVATNPGPFQVAVSPDGHNLYVGNGGGSVQMYDVGSGGALSLAQTITSGVSQPSGVAVSPDGASVYVADAGNDTIEEFDRASDGTLTPKPTPSVAASLVNPNASISVSPNGKSVYADSQASTVINEYDVGSGGELSPKPVPTVATGGDDFLLTISPDGKTAYVPSCDAEIFQYTVGSDGELTPMATPVLADLGCPTYVWFSADGKNAYVGNYDNASVDQYSASGSGLVAKSPGSVSDSGQPGAVLIPPDQGPVAAFTSKTGKSGKATTFDASSSSDSDGTVASYHWSFGDGASTTTTSPTVSHTYKKAGTRTVTLTVTDDSGCSTTQVFTGQTAYCNGTPAATISHTVKITAAAAAKKKSLKLSVSPKSAKAGKKTCYALKATSKGHGVKKATVKLAGHKSTTNGRGEAKLCLTLKKGTYKARATKTGYVAATARVRVSAASPVFTG